MLGTAASAVRTSSAPIIPVEAVPLQDDARPIESNPASAIRSDGRLKRSRSVAHTPAHAASSTHSAGHGKRAAKRSAQSKGFSQATKAAILSYFRPAAAPATSAQNSTSITTDRDAESVREPGASPITDTSARLHRTGAALRHVISGKRARLVDDPQGIPSEPARTAMPTADDDQASAQRFSRAPNVSADDDVIESRPVRALTGQGLSMHLQSMSQYVRSSSHYFVGETTMDQEHSTKLEVNC